MTVLEQIQSNILDSKITTVVGVGIVLGTMLCDAGIVALYASQSSEHAWCALMARAAGYLGGLGLVVSRSPTTPPR